MKYRYCLSLIVLAVMLFPLSAQAKGQCDAYFKFDGDLSDSSGNGYDGQMIAEDGVAATPKFAQGKYGKALHLDGSSAMRALLDLHFDNCPQVTISAWIRVESNDVKGSQYILSTGSGDGPGLHIFGPTVVLDGKGNGLWYRDAIRDKETWFFVAGVFDYGAGTYRLHWRSRIVEGKLTDATRSPEDAFWVGAFNDKLTNRVQSAYVDELRIVGRAMDAEQLAAVQKNAVAEPDDEAQAASTMACSTHAECPAGSYCAWDDTCHPENHAPRRQLELGVADNPVSLVPVENQPPSYEICDSNDCGRVGDSCFDVTVPAEGTDGSMCTRSCTSDSDCDASNGFTGACYALSGTPSICYQRCDKPTDCGIGNTCITTTLPSGLLDGICVPK